MKRDLAGVMMGLSRRGFFDWLPDKAYLKMVYYLRFGHKLDLENPTTFNEKMQWIKLYDRRDLYTQLVDKFAVRDFIRDRIGEEYLIPLLGKWDRAEDIDFDSLPERFVLMCNHDSGSVTICKDKSCFDQKAARRKLSRHLRQGTYRFGREWPYKSVKPCVIAEQYMEDQETGELRDYKFYTFGGKVRAVMVSSNRQNREKQTTFDYFDENYNWMDYQWGNPNAAVKPEKPKRFETMKILAEMLSQNIPHVRVDFYEVNGKVYFGEMTFFDGSGFAKIEPSSWDAVLGGWLTLPKK